MLESISRSEINDSLDELEEKLSSSVMDNCFSIVNKLEERHVIFESQCIDTLQTGTFYRDWISDYPRNEEINRYLELMLLDRGIDTQVGKVNGDFAFSLILEVN